MAVDIFVREAQLIWEELFPFADKNTLDMAAKLGLPSGSAKELANIVDNDRLALPDVSLQSSFYKLIRCLQLR